MAQDRAAFRAIALASAVLILAEGYVQDPMEAVLDAPVGTDPVGDDLIRAQAF